MSSRKWKGGRWAVPCLTDEGGSSSGNAVGKDSPLRDLFSEFLKYTVSRAATLATYQKSVCPLGFKV